MIDCRFKPIEKWPGKPTANWARKAGSFKAGWQNTLDLLERELNYLRAKDISIEGFFLPKDIRNDGWPKSSARPTQPGVVLSFSTKKGRMTMPCDRYTGWEANLRAIALTLEHLRAVERYGVTTEEQEQYTGWLRLPAASAVDEKTEFAKILIHHASVEGRQEFSPNRVLADSNLFDSVWREAVRRTHPDKGGLSVDFRKVINARDRLKELNNW
jgi:hypothetical protein